MYLTCIRCNSPFEDAMPIGYCDACKEVFASTRKNVHARQRPAPGICADGRFADPKECPQSILDETREFPRNVCGLCGSEDLEPGYGLGTGYGMGSYTFCMSCNSFLDFHEDKE